MRSSLRNAVENYTLLVLWREVYDHIVQLLIYYGADVNLSGPDGRTALRAAAWAGNLETVKCLLDAGADVNKSDSEKRTALIAAAYMGHTDVLEALLKAGELCFMYVYLRSHM
ncbi:unnamed protein product [Schistosoma mattheei]|uniref:Uncharacterized protein n=1 Tax=Schistosoma mattheei TaxID=31246 RepID=A0A183PR50_9TREM|nr:unnamed protein product [Schistosoma mattheei]